MIPYHGQPFRNLDEIYRGQAKDGTSHFHAYATVYVVRKGQRYTVALTGVTKGEPLKAVVQRLLRQAASVGVRPRLLLLDRGFYSVAVVRYLQAARSPFLMPVVGHGRSPKQRGGPSGSYVFRTWKKSGWSTYTLTDAKKRTATVSICVKCRNYRGSVEAARSAGLIYAYWGYRAAVAGFGLRQPIGCDWGSSRAIARCTRDGFGPRRGVPAVRLLYVGIALVLRNLWVWLHYTILSMPRRGGRVILLERLRWETLLLWLLHVVEEAFGVVSTPPTPKGM